ncbi:MAG: BrnT family toxin [Candidatus Riflebacteria bacterium]
MNDTIHSKTEKRFICLGKTKQGRCLFVSFLIRDGKVRVISARDMTSREHQEFEKYEKENS